MPTTDTQSTDADLLEAIRQGDERALLTLHQRHIALVYRSAQRVLNDRTEAEECSQDAFLMLWSKRRSVRIYSESILPWLLTTARYLALNRARKLRRSQSREAELGELSDDSPDPLALLVDREKHQDLLQAAAQLSETDRAILSLCVASDLTYKEAAVRLGLTHSAVRNRLSRAKAEMRRTLGRHEGER
ncbi:RNA polymerase sigma factor [Microbacterium sp. W4I20]|uniref:RNA polymerase sigma factor n=1 Tax=Microbacterium sp. W4I20 TaxID=3042262 RepID=UPI002780C154|nr:sigma-70 family RNA polymerase sigma factor [Microbacterium sp. W4I20]MDQ0727130.1 RNA polymerase sigma factor (sigma-70 family) [Microbacterium sp. W4I20]